MGMGQSPLQEGATACKSLILVNWELSVVSDTYDGPKAPPLKVTKCSMKKSHTVAIDALKPCIEK